MVKRNTEPISQTCLRCGGLHFGSYRCPYLDVAVCFACLKTIAAESGSDPHVHPNRKYDAIGRVYHAGCPLSEIDYSCSVDASGARAPTVRDAIILIEKIEECDGMPAKLTLLRNFILLCVTYREQLEAYAERIKEECDLRDALLDALRTASPYIEFYAEREMKSPSNNQEAVIETREMLSKVRKVLAGNTQDLNKLGTEE